LGRGPGRLGVQRWLISVFECLLRLSSKPQGKGAPSSSGMAAAAGFAGDGGDRRRRIRSAWSSRRPRDLNAIFCFFRGFFAIWVEQLSFVSLYNIPVFVFFLN
jgi:hypothetical protein